MKCDVHVLGEIHREADWVGFILVLRFISFIWTVCYWCPLSSHLISVPVCVVSLCRALQPQWSLPPQSVCVCRLSAGAAVQSPCSEWWKCVLFYSGQGGREWRWDVLYRHDCKDDLWRSQMYNKKCQKKLKLCVYYWLDNFLFSQVNTSWAVGKLVWLCFVCSFIINCCWC